MQKRYHLIAIGGSVMHNVAIDLAQIGNKITGSDDEIFEPSKSRLIKFGLLPDKIGWDSERITSDIDAVILGKHAKYDNPELLKAQKLGITIYSFPEFVALRSSARQRVCISGSHGKTSTTSMIMHVLKFHDYKFDYLVGANLKGFDKMVSISDADILVVEGDEYPSSCLDDRAKMLHYNPNIAVVTGIAWDHVNIYKTYEDYKNIFRTFLNDLDADAVCFFDQTDPDLNAMMINEKFACQRISYGGFDVNKKGNVIYNKQEFPIQVFGKHNLLNLEAAFKVCQKLGVNDDMFFEAINHFQGAANRLELVLESDQLIVYKDFAHAPSKCRATISAMRERYPKRRIKAILELHTFSSLDQSFLHQYHGSMNDADQAIVYFDPHALALKKMPDLSPLQIKESFEHSEMTVVNEALELKRHIANCKTDGTEVLLVMSSGGIGGIRLESIFES